MVFARDVARAIMVLYVIGFLTNAEGKTIKKRVVTEVQLMHNWAEYLNDRTRLAWLKRKLAEIIDPNDIPGGLPKPSNEIRLQKKADPSRAANQVAPGEKTLGKTSKADVDILSKVNPSRE
ncbi:parathyroid hormone [Notamacropus eugenii]|uniref:parathyroid hormone n=1 Tax=Notamacropus eugenii TaxID=9315 RepID=UPI003B67A51C